MKLVRNVLAVIVGWVIGSIVNMGLIKIGHTLFPFEGIALNDMNALAEIMPTLTAKYFIFPFLAHALGTLVGALTAGWIAVGYKMQFALGVGGLFLLGGIAVNFMIPGPLWFTIVDILMAYIPMAWIAGKFITPHHR